MAIFTEALEQTLLFPGSLTQGQPEATVELPADDQLRYVRTAAGEEIAVAIRPGASPNSPAVLFCYGNGMSLATAAADLDWLANDNRLAAIPEYVGYGLSSGRPSERGCIEAAEAALGLMEEMCGVSAKRTVFAGWSLGAAVALDLATRWKPAGLALFSPFTSLREMAAAVAPRGFKRLARAVSRLAASRFDNRDKLAQVPCPVFVAHGRRDTLIPFAMAQELAALVPSERRTFVPVALGGHNDLFVAGGVGLRAEFDRFCHACFEPAAGGER